MGIPAGIKRNIQDLPHDLLESISSYIGDFQAVCTILPRDLQSIYFSQIRDKLAADPNIRKLSAIPFCERSAKQWFLETRRVVCGLAKRYGLVLNKNETEDLQLIAKKINTIIDRNLSNFFTRVCIQMMAYGIPQPEAIPPIPDDGDDRAIRERALAIRSWIANPANTPALEAMQMLQLQMLSNDETQRIINHFRLTPEEIQSLIPPNYHLTDLPEEIQFFPNLGDVNLSGNPINELPEWFNPPTLQWLNLSKTRITKLPQGIRLPQLTQLTLYNTQIRELPDHFLRRRELTILRDKTTVERMKDRVVLIVSEAAERLRNIPADQWRNDLTVFGIALAALSLFPSSSSSGSENS